MCPLRADGDDGLDWRDVASVAAVLAAVYLAVSAAPVLASHGTLVVSSQHTDFGTGSEPDPATLENLTVTGSGTSATVTSRALGQIDSFEDADIAEYDGDTDFFDPTTDYARDGSYSLNASTAGSPQMISSTSGLPGYPGPGNSFKTWFRIAAGDSDSAEPRVFWAVQDQGMVYSNVSGYWVQYDADNNEIDLFRSDAGGHNNLATTTGVDLTGGTDYAFDVDWGSDGSITVDVLADDGSSIATVSASDDTYQDGGLGLGVNSGGDDVYIYYDDITGSLTDADRAVYESANHTVTNANQAAINASLTNATMTVTVEEDTGGGWQDVASASYTTTDNHTLDISAASTDKLRVTVTFLNDTSNGQPDYALHDETILSIAQAPAVDNSSASPANGNGTTGTTVDLAINVSDADFQTAGGDELNISYYLDGEYAGSVSKTANGTASLQVSPSGGSHTWHVVVEDQYGHTVQSQQVEFKAPLALSIHRGENLSQLVTEEVNVEIFATGEGANYRDERTTPDGRVVFGDVPDEQLLVQLNATNYTDRQVIINHPYSKTDRHTVLYRENASRTFDQCFAIDSRGAGFAPDQTWLIMQAYIDGAWRDAAGGYFGAANVHCVGMSDGEEYRLVVEDATDRRGLGGYTGDSSFADQVVNLVVEGVQFNLDRGNTYQWEVAGSYNETTQTGDVLFKFNARERDVSDLSLVVYERGNKTNQIESITVPGSVHTYSTNIPLTANQSETEWTVAWEATAGSDGEQISGTDSVRVKGTLVDMGLSETNRKVVVGGFMIIIAGSFSFANAGIGAIILSAATGLLHVFGLYDAPETLVFFMIGLAVVGFVGIKGGGP